MILSTLRPYEIANEPFFMDVISKAMDIGARHGKSGRCHFSFAGRNKLISGDGVRKNLDKVYNETSEYWAKLLKIAHEKGLISYYTDIGKDRKNNRSMVNICATICFPGIPDVSFDLVIATKSFKSALLEAAADGEDVDLDQIADEVYRKNGRTIRATFNSTLRSFGLPADGEYYIVADRASVNIAGFGKSYICCWPHQLDRAFKWTLREMRVVNPQSELLQSLDAIKELTTYSKNRDIIFKIMSADGKSEYSTSPSNPSKTRWLGLLKQVSLFVKAKINVQDQSSRDPGMLAIVENINWVSVEE